MRVITIFRSRLREGVEAEYATLAVEMNQLVATIDGFVDQTFYVAADGERVTIVRFRDADAQRTWAQHPGHLDAQRRGRESLYSWYDVSVCDEGYHAAFDASSEVPRG